MNNVSIRQIGPQEGFGDFVLGSIDLDPGHDLAGRSAVGMLLADGLSQSGPIVIGGMSKVFVCYSLNVRQMRSLPRDRRWTCSEKRNPAIADRVASQQRPKHTSYGRRGLFILNSPTSQ